MTKKASSPKPAPKDKKRNPLKETAILEGALEEFGKNGFEATTISAICKAANVSDATLYEYFKSKEEVLFSIPELYTRRELERVREMARYLRGGREKLRFIIQVYLEFYERNPLYTSVALLTLKGSRNFINTPAYEVVREASRSIVDAYNEGVGLGEFRDDLDGRLVRNLVLGFIEHVTVQWLLTGRPESIAALQDTIFELVMRAVEKPKELGVIEMKVDVAGLAS